MTKTERDQLTARIHAALDSIQSEVQEECVQAGGIEGMVEAHQPDDCQDCAVRGAFFSSTSARMYAAGIIHAICADLLPAEFSYFNVMAMGYEVGRRVAKAEELERMTAGGSTT